MTLAANIFCLGQTAEIGYGAGQPDEVRGQTAKEGCNDPRQIRYESPI